MSNLQGLHIVITRPRAQAEPWAKRLQEMGAKVYILPLMEIVPLQDAAQIHAIKHCILNFNNYSKAIFVSQNAVQQGFTWLENYWPQLPVGVKFFAVGETTANLLQSYGVRVTDLAHTQGGAMTSETLVQSPDLQQVMGEKILIFRGLGGRNHLGESLSARGAKVDYCELYKRQLPEFALTQAKQLFQCDLVENSGPNWQRTVISLHSGEAFTNLISVLNSIGVSESKLKQLRLLVPSERIARQAESAGFSEIYTAENATDTAMLQRLMSIHLT